MLLSAGAVVYEHGEHCRSALVEIVRASQSSIPPPFQLRVFDLLVEFGANVNEQDDEGRTALHHAALVNNSELALRLLKAGVDKDTVDNYGKTAAEYCVPSFDSHTGDLMRPRRHNKSHQLHQTARERLTTSICCVLEDTLKCVCSVWFFNKWAIFSDKHGMCDI